MSLQSEAKRVKYGQSLTDFQTQAVNSINALKGIRTNVISMRDTAMTDPDFTQADVDEINAKLTLLDNAISNILT